MAIWGCKIGALILSPLGMTLAVIFFMKSFTVGDPDMSATLVVCACGELFASMAFFMMFIYLCIKDAANSITKAIKEN